MENLKDNIGNILFYFGLVMCALSIIGGLLSVEDLEGLAFAIIIVGVLQGLLVCGIGVIADHLKEIKSTIKYKLLQ